MWLNPIERMHRMAEGSSLAVLEFGSVPGAAFTHDQLPRPQGTVVPRHKITGLSAALDYALGGFHVAVDRYRAATDSARKSAWARAAGAYMTAYTAIQGLEPLPDRAAQVKRAVELLLEADAKADVARGMTASAEPGSEPVSQPAPEPVPKSEPAPLVPIAPPRTAGFGKLSALAIGGGVLLVAWQLLKKKPRREVDGVSDCGCGG